MGTKGAILTFGAAHLFQCKCRGRSRDSRCAFWAMGRNKEENIPLGGSNIGHPSLEGKTPTGKGGGSLVTPRQEAPFECYQSSSKPQREATAASQPSTG